MMRKAGVGALVLLGLLATVVLLNLFVPRAEVRPGVPLVAYSDVLQLAAEKQLQSVVIQGGVIRGFRLDGQGFQAHLPDDPGLAARLAAQGVRVLAQPAQDSGGVLRYLLSWVPTLILFGVLAAGLRRVSRGLAAIEAQVSRLAVSAQRQGGPDGTPLAGIG